MPLFWLWPSREIFAVSAAGRRWRVLVLVVFAASRVSEFPEPLTDGAAGLR